jgi:transposase InsO family protein
MEAIYHISGISRQGHFRARVRSLSKIEREAHILSAVRLARIEHPRMGSRPLHKMLGIEGMGINQFERLLSEEGLGIQGKRNRRKTTDGHLFKGRATNKINGMVLTGINQLWVSDITYFQTGSEVFYIIMIMDVYSRRLLGAGIYPDMFSENNLSVLEQSLKLRGIAHYGGHLIHHSDKGSQYMSEKYKKKLTSCGIQLSVAENSLQNGYAERINGTIKNDYLQFFHSEDIRQLRKHLKRCVWLYNSQRPHSSLGYLTPEAYEKSLNDKQQKEMVLYDFKSNFSDEFFSGICDQNGCSKNKKQAPKEEPAIPIGQGYSSIGCPPAEPLSASPCQNKDICSHFNKLKKL